jgi:outer membrane receptor protein involved in Fe transport
VDESTEEDIDTYKIHFEYRVNDDILAYALASSGYRAGGFNRSGFADVSPASAYGTDTLWNYEVGAKTSWLDNRLTANVVAYYIDWSDIQLFAFDSVSLSAKIQNAGKAEVFGFETEIRYKATENLQLNANYAYADAALAEDYVFTGTTPPTVLGADGDRLPGSSMHTFSVFADWQSPLTSSLDLAANVNYIYMSSRKGSISPVEQPELPSLGTLNLSIGIKHDAGVSVSLFANNLLDERRQSMDCPHGESDML